MNKGNQMYNTGALAFDPIYRAKSTVKEAPPDPKAPPKFPLHVNPHAPFAVVPAAKYHEDGSITVSIFEPNAKTAILTGVSFSLPDGPYPMTRQDNGYFSVTLRNLRPGLHHYAFEVDGVHKLDPDAPIAFGCGTMINLLEVPDPDGAYYELQKVPHGTLRFEHIWSDLCESYRPCWIYTPPEYDQHPEKRYPVLYIQHGGGENEGAWIWTARINYIADNFIAQGKMKEMIIVCNTGFVPKRVGEDLYADQSFEEIFIKELVPFVDQNYRTIPDRLSRAMAGLSMGGGQSRCIVHNHPDMFAWLGQFSSGAGFVIKSETGFYGQPADYSELFDTPEHYNERMKLTFISCGLDDPRHAYTSRQVEEVASQGFNVSYHAYPGNHEWEPWRMSLRDFLPLLFQ